MTPIRVLLAENEPEVAHLIQKRMEGAGYNVETVEDGNKAWELLQAGNYCLLICDVQLPGMSGWELMKNIFRNSEFGGLPIIAITGLAIGSDVVEGDFYWDRLIQRQSLLNDEGFEEFLIFLARLLNLFGNSS